MPVTEQVGRTEKEPEASSGGPGRETPRPTGPDAAAPTGGPWRLALRRLLPLLCQPLTTPASRHIFYYIDTVSLFFTVSLVTLGIKAVLAGLDLSDVSQVPCLYADSWPTTLAQILACCSEDLALGLLGLFVAAVGLRLVAGRVWGRRLLRALVYFLALALLLFLVINAHLFHHLRRFLTWELFEAGGGLQLETSIEEYARSPVFQITIVIIPLGALASHLLLRQVRWFWRWLVWGLCRPLVILLLAGLLWQGASRVQATWFAGGPSDFAQSPPLVFLRSLWAEPPIVAFGHLGGDIPDWPAEQVADFLPGPPHPADRLVPPPRNLVLICAESLAAPYLQLYGAPYPNTPNLCRLLEQKKGIVFTNFYATATKTIASALPLFGSLYNDVRARQATVLEYEQFPVPAAARWLKQHGYKTYFLTANGSGWDVFLNIAQRFTPPGLFDVGREPTHPFWSQGGLEPQRLFADNYLDAAAFADARRVLDDAQGQPFYLMLWNYETHYPYYPGAGPRFDRRQFPASLASRPDEQQDFDNYLRAIWRLDALLGEFYQELEKRGLAEDTLVVLTGDHGEAWGQHHTWLHGESVYEEEVHVPLVMLWPRLAALGPRQEVVGDHVSLWPTLADLCGLPPPPRWQGRSLFRALPGEPRRAYFHNHGSSVLGVREGKWKYILNLKRQQELLFDLDSDPQERHDLAPTQAARCAALRQRLQVWVQYQSWLTQQYLEAASAE
jgi:arylsulfatase A-like enzyme